RHHRRAYRQRFGEGVRRAFPVGGEHEQGGLGHISERIVYETRQGHVRRYPKLLGQSLESWPQMAIAEYYKAAWHLGSYPREGAYQHREVLLIAQSSRTQDDGGLAGGKPWMTDRLTGQTQQFGSYHRITYDLNPVAGQLGDARHVICHPLRNADYSIR